jgi:hypothetical protein
MAGARVLVSATAAALLVAVVSVGGEATAAPDRPSSFSVHATKLPSPLVGSWTHFFTAAYWAQVGITDEPPEHLSLYVPAEGNVAVGEFYIRFTPLSGNRLAISGRWPDCGKTKSIYRWKVANRRLTLTKLQDRCNESVAILNGVVWAREGVF